MSEPTDLTTGSTWTADEQNTLDADVNNLNAEMAAEQAALSTSHRQAARNTIAAVGDSNTALGSEGWYQPWLGHTWLNQLQVMTHQRIRYGAGNFSVAGTTIDTQQSAQLPRVLAMNPLPGACVLAVATNDIQSSTYDFGVTVTKLKEMIAAVDAAGIVPILWCPPPNNHVGSVSIATIHARTYQWNTWIRRFAAANGYPLVDAFTAVAQADGTAIPGTINPSDLIHLTGYGHRLVAEQALADGLADVFRPNSLVNTARTTDDLSNMLNNGTINLGLFTTDTNSDGVADGLSKGTPGTASIETPQPDEQIAGKWQRLDVPATQTGNMTAVFSTGWSIDDTVAFSYRLKTKNIETNLGWHMGALKTDTPGGFTTPDGLASLTYLWNGPVQWDNDINDGEMYVEFVIPPAATDLQLWISLFGGAAGAGCSLWVAEMTARNLTTGGILI